MVYWFLSPVNCFIIDCASYFAFLVLFAWVILTKFCIEACLRLFVRGNSRFEKLSDSKLPYTVYDIPSMIYERYLSNKLKITFFEYILLIWLISIQIERMKKFAAMANKPRAEKIKLLKKDKWNAVYLLAFLTCLGTILLSRGFVKILILLLQISLQLKIPGAL